MNESFTEYKLGQVREQATLEVKLEDLERQFKVFDNKFAGPSFEDGMSNRILAKFTALMQRRMTE